MRQITFTLLATGLMTTALAGPLSAQQGVPVAGPLAKSVSPEVAPGVADVEAFVAAAGYAVKGAAPVSDQPQDIATKGPGLAAPARAAAQTEARAGVDAPNPEAVVPPAPTDDAAETRLAMVAPEQPPEPEQPSEPETAPAPAAAPVGSVEPVVVPESAPEPKPEPEPEPIVFPNDPQALHDLGIALIEGTTRPVNEVAAAKAFSLAAKAGNPAAMFELGWAFETGRGVAPAVAFAVQWYNRAIDAGEARAMNNLGFLYANGRGVPRNPEKAVELYRMGAEAGEPSAMGNLGWMMENGIGTAQDLLGAARWYEKAAQGGDTQAMLALGNMYLIGDALERDPREALVWFARARAAGRVEALSYMAEIFESPGDLHDPERAAKFYVQALSEGDGWVQTRAQRAWDGRTAVALQRELAARGLYDGPIDGAIGPGSRAAMQALLSAAQNG